MKINPQLAYRIEIAGLILILFATFWQFMLEDTVSEILDATETYQINQKLDILWLYTGKLGDKIVQDRPIRAVADWGDLDERWRRLEEQEDYVARQTEVFRSIRAALFLIGSVLLTSGRFYELRERVDREVGSNGTAPNTAARAGG